MCSSNSVLYTVQVHIETIAHPNNCQRFFLTLRIPFFHFTQIFARITDNSLTSLLFLSKYCAKTNWARIRSAIISVQASLSKYPRVSALGNLLFSSLNALLCSSPNLKHTPFFDKLQKGLATVAVWDKLYIVVI